MTRYRFLLTLFCITGIPFIAYRAWPREERPEPSTLDRRTPAERQADVVAWFGGEDGFTTVLNAERVEAYRIQPPEDNPHASGPACSITSGPVAVPYFTRRDLSGKLTREEWYGWGYVVGCEPSYGVRLSFFRDNDRVDADLCLSCGLIHFYRNGVSTGGALMGPLDRELLQVAKKLFPEDGAIQQLD